jgi:hypothetical protein
VNILEVLIVHNAMFVHKPSKLHLTAAYYKGRDLKNKVLFWLVVKV